MYSRVAANAWAHRPAIEECASSGNSLGCACCNSLFPRRLFLIIMLANRQLMTIDLRFLSCCSQLAFIERLFRSSFLASNFYTILCVDLLLACKISEIGRRQNDRKNIFSVRNSRCCSNNIMSVMKPFRSEFCFSEKNWDVFARNSGIFQWRF